MRTEQKIHRLLMAVMNGLTPLFLLLEWEKIRHYTLGNWFCTDMEFFGLELNDAN
jgi:hypothetical protein